MYQPGFVIPGSGVLPHKPWAKQGEQWISQVQLSKSEEMREPVKVAMEFKVG